MTMFWAEKRRFCGGYGGGERHSQVYGYSSLGSDPVCEMRTEEESGEESREEEWLQLGIGGGGRQQDLLITSPASNVNGSASASGLVELELMPSSSNHSQIRPDFTAPRPVAQQEINWGFRPILMPSTSFPRPFQIYGGGVDFRVVQPPRRPHSGLWFMLQASPNQEKEPFLPQINKSYLRIKDGRMTIRLVIKYLVSKLSLESESEIEIRCKGQRLVPFLTLQHVRDNIWSSSRDFITLLPNSSPTHHIMVLHYARTLPSN